MTDDSDQQAGDERALVPLIKDIGGALLTVLSWQGYANLTAGAQLAIAEIVEENDALNTQTAVDYIAAVAQRHGPHVCDWWGELLSEHGLETVILAFDSLEDLGWRGDYGLDGKLSEPDELEERFNLIELVEFLEMAARAGMEFVTSEGVTDFINRCGGWEVVRGLNEEDIVDIRDNPDRAAELRTEYVRERASKFDSSLKLTED